MSCQTSRAAASSFAFGALTLLAKAVARGRYLYSCLLDPTPDYRIVVH